MLWQWLFARTAHAALAWPHYFILGAAVWLSYAGDRWFEGWLVPPAQVQTQRLRFYQRRRRFVFFFGGALLLATIATAWRRLAPREFDAGLAVFAAVLAYLFSHQLLHRGAARRVPKEICVAVLFMAGCALFALAARPAAWPLLAAPVALFGLLCFANCLLISTWEIAVDVRHGSESLALGHDGSRAYGRWLPWIAALLGGTLAAVRPDLAGRAAGLCALASGALLGIVSLAQPRLGRRPARVLADVALMTPLAPLLLAHLRL